MTLIAESQLSGNLCNRVPLSQETLSLSNPHTLQMGVRGHAHLPSCCNLEETGHSCSVGEAGSMIASRARWCKTCPSLLWSRRPARSLPRLCLNLSARAILYCTQQRDTI